MNSTTFSMGADMAIQPPAQPPLPPLAPGKSYLDNLRALGFTCCTSAIAVMWVCASLMLLIWAWRVWVCLKRIVLLTRSLVGLHWFIQIIMCVWQVENNARYVRNMEGAGIMIMLREKRMVAD